MLEKEIEDQCLDWLKQNQIFAFKVKSTATFDPRKRIFRKINPRYRRGCPDILACISGLMVGLEIKTKAGRVSDVQKEFHRDLLAAGGEVHIIRSLEDLKRAIGERS